VSLLSLSSSVSLCLLFSFCHMRRGV